MNDQMFRGDEELVILRPSETERTYAEFVRCFVDEGIYFPFGERDELPEGLPEDLGRVKCLMMDAKTRTILESGSAATVLRRFMEEGGQVYVPDPKIQVGGALGYFAAMHNVQRVICCSGLTPRHPKMLERMRGRDEAKLVTAWRSAAVEEFRQYEGMKHYFGDPIGFITLRACDEAADFFHDPSYLEPGDRYLSAHYLSFGTAQGERTGGRYLLKFHERTGRKDILDQVVAYERKPKLWRQDGVHLNMDLHVPEGMDPNKPPKRILDNAWIWPEAGADLGDTWGYLSKVTGDPSWAEMAVRHVTKAFLWLYNPANGLIMHIGRPGGPDLRSAPWGRGIAWYLYSVRGLLDDLPESHPARPELCRILKTVLDGLLRYQDEYGLWHNVVDASVVDSRPCASATSRFLHVYARAYNKGWLRDERIPEMVEKAWVGLKTKIWENGLIAFCVGTSYSLSRQVYLSRPHHTFRSSRSEMLINWMERERMKSV